MQREITDEYNQAQEFQRNVANVDYTTMVVNDILTRMCVIEHNGYHTAVVSYGKVIFIMSISFRYDDAAPLIYNITRYVGENSFEQWIGEVVLDATLPNSRRFGTMFAMRTNKDKNDIRINNINTCNFENDTSIEDVMEIILQKVKEWYPDWIKIRYITK